MACEVSVTIICKSKCICITYVEKNLNYFKMYPCMYSIIYVESVRIIFLNINHVCVYIIYMYYMYTLLKKM